MDIMRMISIATNVSFQGITCTWPLPTFIGGEYGHYANEPHCYKCKSIVVFSDSILINITETAR